MAFLKWFCKRIILILIIIFLSVTLGMIYILGANAGMNQTLTQEDIQKMQRHIEKVKFTNPAKYQAMIKRAGGNITHCCNCHTEACNSNVQRSPIVVPPIK
jgi:hypothetical protein